MIDDNYDISNVINRLLCICCCSIVYNGEMSVSERKNESSDQKSLEAFIKSIIRMHWVNIKKKS